MKAPMIFFWTDEKSEEGFILLMGCLINAGSWVPAASLLIDLENRKKDREVQNRAVCMPDLTGLSAYPHSAVRPA
jgi:hypothetical protein